MEEDDPTNSEWKDETKNGEEEENKKSKSHGANTTGGKLRIKVEKKDEIIAMESLRNPWSWKPNFNLMEATNDRLTSWVRLLGLAIKYYETEMLKFIGNVIGKTLKVDSNTKEKSRDKFTRLCVELDLTEPLVSQYAIKGTRCMVEYERIHMIYFSCGMVGHDKDKCPRKSKKTQEQDGSQTRTDNNGRKRENEQTLQRKGYVGNIEKQNENKGKEVIRKEHNTYGPWMVVQKPMHGGKSGRTGSGTGSGLERETSTRGKSSSYETRYVALQKVNENILMENENRSTNHVEPKNIPLLKTTIANPGRPKTKPKSTRPHNT
ncbi:hypothetical protein AHAS_Ahas09G0124300 [Arachis hypogaea]